MKNKVRTLEGSAMRHVTDSHFAVGIRRTKGVYNGSKEIFSIPKKLNAIKGLHRNHCSDCIGFTFIVIFDEQNNTEVTYGVYSKIHAYHRVY